MKIFKKNFINEITNEIGAAINVERYLSVNYLLQKAKVKTPKILSYDKNSVTLEFIELQHAKINPDFDAFHFSRREIGNYYNFLSNDIFWIKMHGNATYNSSDF
jgi:hypothetical protein